MKDTQDASPVKGHYETTLRPWGEVARMYTEKTGKPITRFGAAATHTKAIRKMRAAFAALEAK